LVRDRIYKITNWLGLCLFGAMLFTGAVESFRSKGRLPGISLIFGTYIYDLVNQGEYEQAVRQMKIAIDINVSLRARLNLELAEIAKQHGDTQTMVSALLASRAIHPFDDAQPYNDLTYGLLSLNRSSDDLQLAVQVAREGLNRFPQYAPLYCNLGAARYALGEYEESFHCFQHALLINPNLKQAQIGMSMFQRGQP